jgi:flagellar assembly protein FliH
MPVIKASNAPSSMLPFSVRDIEEQAAAMLAHAQAQVEKLHLKAKADAVQTRQKAYDEGFAAGHEDGLKKGNEDGRAAGKQSAFAEHKAKLEQLVKTITAALNDIDSSRHKLESLAGSDVIRLAVAIARRVTKLQGSQDPIVLTENVRAAVKLVVHSADVRIAVHPTQKQSLTEALPQLRMQWPNLTHVEVIEDAEIAPGGCRVFTAAGQIDADLDCQIDRVAADLLPNSQAS